jgi:two-component system chemotaxis response regulator CheB
MNKIRVLIVDDSVVVRRLVTDVLASDPAVEVAGTAPNGRIGLARLTQLNPDVVVLDVEMPEMDGLQTLAALRQTHPRLPVIMFSRFTQRGAAATLEALTLGASDFVAKPEENSPEAAAREVREQLLPRIKQLAAPKDAASTPVPVPRALSDPFLGRRPLVQVVAIGASTGGPNALVELFASFPADWPVPVLVVQHMPPLFTRLLAERLTARAALSVAEAVAGAALRPGQAWIAPGDHHLTVARVGDGVRVQTHQGPPENSCRPSADVLLRSVAAVFGPAVLAVVLTGMGQDGLRGCEAVRQAGGQVLVQDEATSVVWGMPGAVARAGLADLVLPLEQLGPEIVRRVRRGRSPSSPGTVRL